MKAIVLMFDSLNRHMLPPYADTFVEAPNFARLAERAVTFENFYAGSMPCMPARRELHTGRYNFLHRSWGPLEPFDDSMPQMLREAGVHTHLVSDHPHYWEDGGGTYHTRYSTWEFLRGQEGDPWKGVASAVPADASLHTRMVAQDAVNRRHMRTEAEHSQTRTVDAGLEFIAANAGADRWMLQIELFDPHEPFFAPDAYRAGYLHDSDGPALDWPGYRKVTEPEPRVEQTRREYAALVSMCDHSLGRVLDAIDEHGLWEDTMLVVNTDHGFLLGEHGWWAKSVQPWFNELVHLPMFLWDPGSAERGSRRVELAQTIDIAPTVLRHFGIEATEDMQGIDLAAPAEREAALFGVHGGHVNVTDGRYVYMRASAGASNAPLDEYTLMPTHMRSRFSPSELRRWEPADPFAFTKGVRTMRMPATQPWMNPWRHGTLLFDLATDSRQQRPLVDDELELRMIRLLVEQMRAAEAPASQFARLGLPEHGEPAPEHLLVREQAQRAAAMAEPLPGEHLLPAPQLLNTSLSELLTIPGARRALERRIPELLETELVSIPAGLTILEMAGAGSITAAQLIDVSAELDKLAVPA